MLFQEYQFLGDKNVPPPQMRNQRVIFFYFIYKTLEIVFQINFVNLRVGPSCSFAKRHLSVCCRSLTLVTLFHFSNVKCHPRTGHDGPEEKYRYRFTVSITSALDWGGW